MANIRQDNFVGYLGWDVGANQERCQQVFTVDMAVPFGCNATQRHWQFSPGTLNPQPDISEADGAEATVVFHKPGVCNITFDGADDCGNTWRGTGVYYVIGGPFTVTTEGTYVVWQHDDPQDNRRPWYINYFGYQPTGGDPIGGKQPTIKGVATAQYQPPPGTTLEWQIIGSAADVGPDSPNKSTIRIRATAGSFSAGDILLHLLYRKITTAGNYSCLDDSAYMWSSPPGDWNLNYTCFTSHRPLQFDAQSVSNAVYDDPQPYSCSRNFNYRLVDTVGHHLPLVWEQERFPFGVPPGLAWNGSTGIWWTTTTAATDDGTAGWLPGTADTIRCWATFEWTEYWNEDFPLIEGNPHQYWAGTMSPVSGAGGLHTTPDHDAQGWTDAVYNDP